MCRHLDYFRSVKVKTWKLMSFSKWTNEESQAISNLYRRCIGSTAKVWATSSRLTVGFGSGSVSRDLVFWRLSSHLFIAFPVDGVFLDHILLRTFVAVLCMFIQRTYTDVSFFAKIFIQIILIRVSTSMSGAVSVSNVSQILLPTTQ